MEDLLELLESLRPCEEGVGVVGQCAGESSAASESRSAVALKPLLSAKEEEQQEEEEEEEESSRVFGTYKHRFIPKAIFAFLHLLPIFLFLNII